MCIVHDLCTRPILKLDKLVFALRKCHDDIARHKHTENCSNRSLLKVYIYDIRENPSGIETGFEAFRGRSQDKISLV